MKYKILIIDDEPANLRVLERLFRRDYQVVTAESGFEGLELLKHHNFALIMSDQRMPGMTGIEFLIKAAEMRPQTVRIILTGYTDVGALVEAINSVSIYKYVNKPWINEELKQTVIRAIEHYETIKGGHELKQHNKRLSEDLKATKHGFVQFIADILNTRDQYAYAHAFRTKECAAAIGSRLNMKVEEIKQLSLAAYLCEIGKLSIPDNILHKVGTLTEDERKIVERNTEHEARMMEGIPGMDEIALVVRYQYEHYDGSRAPSHLMGEQIPLYARIISVASNYDLMTNPREPENSLTHEEAIEQLQLQARKKFDPDVIDAFCEINSKPKFDVGLIEQAFEAQLSAH